MRTLFAVIIAASATAAGHAADYSRCVRSHLDRVIGRSVDSYGPEHTQMWLATIDRLYDARSCMFRSHPGQHRCDAVDGPGHLLLALLYLDGGGQRESAFAF